MKALKLILLVVGFCVLILTIQGVGVQTLAENILCLRWKLLPVLFFYFFVYAFNAAGWSWAFAKPLPRCVPFREIYVIRIIGETLNSVMPFCASVGGEPIKAELIRRRFGVPLSDGYASLLIVHTTLWASLNLFVLGAIALTLRTRPLTPFLWKSVFIFLVLLAVAAVGLLIGLHYGLFKRIYALGEHFKWWHEGHKEIKTKFLKLDDEIKRFYTKNRRRFLLSTFFNFLAWFVGVFEVYYVARILGLPVSLTEAWLMEALIQVLRIVTFMIPSSIGAQEGGILVIFSHFGFSAPLSLTFALIRRLREIVWIGIGLLLWTLTEDRPA